MQRERLPSLERLCYCLSRSRCTGQATRVMEEQSTRNSVHSRSVCLGFCNRQSCSIPDQYSFMGSVEKVLFLHGIGEDRDAWDWQIQRLPTGFEGEAADVLSTKNQSRKKFSTSEAAERIWDSVDEPQRVHLCGLSLGALIALEMIRIAPDRVASLTLAGGQVRPPRGLMALQRLIVRLVPSRGLQKSGVSKQLILEVLREVSRMDFRSLLPAIQVPTLVLCGQRDHANLPAARKLAAGIPGARLELLAGAGHQAQLDAPEGFSELLTGHLLGVERD